MGQGSKGKKRLMGVLLTFLMVLGMVQLPVMPARAAASGTPSIHYAVHSQTYGWMNQVSDGKTAGTSGQSKRLEAIVMSLDMNGATASNGAALTGGIRFQVHSQTYGWMNWVNGDSNGASVNSMIQRKQYAGTIGQSKRLEAIKIELTGVIAQEYDVLYRVHCQTYGWMPWVKNGELAGTTGKSKRLEAIEIKLIKKPSIDASITYSVHCQTYGWMNPVSGGSVAGTTGQSKRLEALKLQLNCTGVTGGVEYSTHMQSYGWTSKAANGAVGGVTGKAKRMEAVKISLTGDISAYYDIYYRTHVQSYGWLDWAKNGQEAGTAGMSKRMEAIQIQLVPKGGAAPGATTTPYKVFTGPTKDTYVIKVNKQACCITVYQGGKPIKAMTCSPGDSTPTGTYHIPQKWRWQTLMGGVQGQYTSQITGNFLFHSVLYDSRNIYSLTASSYNNLGKRVSHGCVRLRVADAKWIYDNCPVGTTVIIYNDSNPGPLGKPVLKPIPSYQKYDPSDPAI